MRHFYVGDRPITKERLQVWLENLLREGKVQPGPVEAGNVFAEALALDQRLSSEKARSELDWRPRHESFVAEAPILYQQWHAAQ